MKKTMKKSMILLLCGLLIGGVFTGCNTQKTENSEVEYAPEEIYDVGAVEGESDDIYMNDGTGLGEEAKLVDDASMTDTSTTTSETTDISQTSATNRKLIRNASLTVETREFDSLIPNIQNKATELGGYVEMSDISGTGLSDDTYRYANYTIRIPEDKFDQFITNISEISNITYKYENVTDVTLNYVDIEAQKEALEVEQDRLMAILEKADTIETIVALESRLTEVRYELQSFESQLRTYDNLVDYATVSISVQEVEKLTPAENKTAWNRMTNGFKDSVYNIQEGFKNFGIGIVIAIPYLIIILIIIMIIYFVIRGIIKKIIKKIAKKKLNKQTGVINNPIIEVKDEEKLNK